MKFHSRHEHMAKTGKRISRGSWERMNRAYAVHGYEDHGRPKLRVVDYVRHRNGEIKLDANGRPTPLVIRSVTHVLMPETTKANRKVRLRDRFGERSKRSRYNNSSPLGFVR